MPASSAPDPPAGVPSADYTTGEPLVRLLLTAQHPDLAELPIVRYRSGWDNDIYRLGDDLAVRMPRRRVAVENLVKEQRWLPRLAPLLTLPVPVPVRVGVAGSGFPWPWSIVPWFDGAAADPGGLDVRNAEVLGRFLRSLHVPAPEDAPRSPVRGVDLATRAAPFEARLQRIADGDGELPVGEIRSAWARLSAIPVDDADTWIHGDLHPGNLIVENGRLVAVGDWGDLCAGDPATDLAAAWMTFPNELHPVLRAAYGDTSTEAWGRARGWALYLALLFLDGALGDDLSLAGAGRTMLRRVMTDADR